MWYLIYQSRDGPAYDGGTHALGACRLGSIPSGPNAVRTARNRTGVRGTPEGFPTRKSIPSGPINIGC